MLGAYGFLRGLFEVFERHQTVVDVVTTSEVSVSLRCNAASPARYCRRASALGTVAVESDRAIVCVVGEGLRTTPGIAARVFATISDINVSLISQGASASTSPLWWTKAECAKRCCGCTKRCSSASRRTWTRRRHGGSVTDPVSLACDLVDVPSVSGEEAQVARFVASYLTDLGYRVELFDAAPGDPMCSHHGSSTADRVLHPPRYRAAAHARTTRGRRPVRPRGLRRQGDHGRRSPRRAAPRRGVDGIGLLFVVDEEMGSVGARAANAHPLARECRWLIDGEPTDNRLAIGTKDRSASRCAPPASPPTRPNPEHGRSAIDALLDVLGDVRRATWPTDPLFGETTVNIGVIAGGARRTSSPRTPGPTCKSGS